MLGSLLFLTLDAFFLWKKKKDNKKKIMNFVEHCWIHTSVSLHQKYTKGIGSCDIFISVSIESIWTFDREKRKIFFLVRAIFCASFSQWREKSYTGSRHNSKSRGEYPLFHCSSVYVCFVSSNFLHHLTYSSCHVYCVVSLSRHHVKPLSSLLL